MVTTGVELTRSTPVTLEQSAPHEAVEYMVTNFTPTPEALVSAPVCWLNDRPVEPSIMTLGMVPTVAPGTIVALELSVRLPVTQRSPLRIIWQLLVADKLPTILV